METRVCDKLTPAMTYGAETWPITKHDMNEKPTLIWTYRLIGNYERSDPISVQRSRKNCTSGKIKENY